MKNFIFSILFLSFLASSSAQRNMIWINQTDHVITEMYISMIDTDFWGESVLETAVSPGEQTTIMFPYCEDYNIKIINQEGDSCMLDQVYICTDNVDEFSNKWLGCFLNEEE